MGPLRSPIAPTGLAPLRWTEICARREAGGQWTATCPLCREPLAHRDDDLRWLADFGRLVSLPDGCPAHRYCAIENPHRNPALIVDHAHEPLAAPELRARRAS